MMKNILSTIPKLLMAALCLSIVGISQSALADRVAGSKAKVSPLKSAASALPSEIQLEQINQGNWEVLKQYLGVDTPHVFVQAFKSEYVRDPKHPTQKKGVVYQFCKVLSSSDKNFLVGDVIILPTGVEGDIVLTKSFPPDSQLFIFNPRKLTTAHQSGNPVVSADTTRLPIGKGRLTARGCQLVKVVLNKQAGHPEYQ